MNDVINRKDAIGAILSIRHEAELSDGDAVIRVSAVNYVLMKLPSAHCDYCPYPDDYDGRVAVVRCRDCKHRDPEDKKCDCGHDIQWQLPRDDDWYCADAERRTDEQADIR